MGPTDGEAVEATRQAQAGGGTAVGAGEKPCRVAALAEEVGVKC
jgi:hypothetical protein